ncbi:MAG: hypothetical protein OWQ56_01030 [Acidithiobacillus caldus]|nr:hypothetical protein [Acidithiobacillus caldus]
MATPDVRFRGVACADLLEDYLDRLDCTYPDSQATARLGEAKALLEQLLALPPDFLLEDLPALLVPYHDHLSQTPEELVVHPQLQEMHTELMRHLGFDTEQVSAFLDFAQAMQRCSRTGGPVSLQDSEPEADAPDDEDKEGVDYESAPIRNYFDSLEDGGA